jgi:hypothetical protein
MRDKLAVVYPASDVDSVMVRSSGRLTAPLKSNIMRLSLRSRKKHPGTSEWGWWARHLTYDHGHIPVNLDVQCPSCGQKAIARTTAANGRDSIFDLRCNTCFAAKAAVPYAKLPPLFYRIAASGRELWAWNREHLAQLLSILEHPSDTKNRGSLTRSFVRREWLVHRRQFAKAIRRVLGRSHNISVNSRYNAPVTSNVRPIQVHTQAPVVLSRLSLTRFSAVGDGMHLEVSAPANEGNSAEPFLTFREDELLGLQVVVHLDGRDVAFPLSELKLAIATAESDVHRESSYD